MGLFFSAFSFSRKGKLLGAARLARMEREEAGCNGVAASFLSLPSEKPPKAAWKEHWKTLALLKQ